MNITDLRDHIDRKFDHLENRIDDLESSRDFMSGVWKALTIIGGGGVVVLGFYIRIKL